MSSGMPARTSRKPRSTWTSRSNPSPTPPESMREGGSRSSPGPGPGSSGDPHQPPELALHDTGVGPAILLLHAFPMDASQWDHQVAALSGDFRCLRPDMWGCGESQELPEPLLATLDGYAAAVLRSLDAAGVRDRKSTRLNSSHLGISY